LRAIIDDTTGPNAAELLGRRWAGAEQHGRNYMLINKVSINVLAPTEVEVMKSKLEPLLDASVDALEKSGKPARVFLEEYRK